MRFSPEYVACVLNDNFEDAKALFLAPLMRIHYAHLVMLTERGIVTRDRSAGDSRRRSTAISMDDVRKAAYDGTLRRSVLLRRAPDCGSAAAKKRPDACTRRARATTST